MKSASRIRFSPEPQSIGSSANPRCHISGWAQQAQYRASIGQSIKLTRLHEHTAIQRRVRKGLSVHLPRDTQHSRPSTFNRQPVRVCSTKPRIKLFEIRANARSNLLLKEISSSQPLRKRRLSWSIHRQERVGDDLQPRERRLQQLSRPARHNPR